VSILALVLGLTLIAIVLWDAFETVVLPRTVSRRVRLARFYVRGTWLPWRRIARAIGSESRRERFLAIYGPVSLLGLLAVWAFGLVAGFAVVHWAVGSPLVTDSGAVTFLDDLYMSGSTFFTLGLGDVHPATGVARVLTVTEGGLGFAFLAIVISYLPVFYQAFSRREVRLTLLDAWAGSPPAAAEVLRRLAAAGELKALEPFLKDWEYWCSDLLESHISYPSVAYFRSQHQRQSWISALTTVLDLSAMALVGIEGLPVWQARVTFAIARHAAVDLAQVFRAAPDYSANRLSRDDFARLWRLLEDAGLGPSRAPEAEARLAELRSSYEPFIVGLGRYLMMPVPSWWRQGPWRDNWESSPRRKGDQHL
jgi:hypothetical protein